MKLISARIVRMAPGDAISRRLFGGESDTERGLCETGAAASSRGQLDREGRAALVGLDLDASAVLDDDLLGQRQAQAGSTVLGREERLEDLGQVLDRDAWSVVLDADLDPAAGGAPGRHPYPAALEIGRAH